MTELAVLAQSPADLDRYADPGEYVVGICERAKSWLTECLARNDIEAIGETKAQAEAIRIYTIQKQLGKDSELAAAEVVRRAERGIGVAIRRGQEAGEVRVRGQHDFTGNQHVSGLRRDATMTSPATYLTSSTERTHTYAVTDGVTDEHFDTALTEAKSEGNLSRANVVRKVGRAVPASTALSGRVLDHPLLPKWSRKSSRRNCSSVKPIHWNPDGLRAMNGGQSPLRPSTDPER